MMGDRHARGGMQPKKSKVEEDLPPDFSLQQTSYGWINQMFAEEEVWPLINHIGI